MREVLIIGSEGFIGKRVGQYFKEMGDAITGCDLQDVKFLEYKYYKISRLDPGFDRIFQDKKFDVCINAAGSGSVPNSISNPFGDFEANTVDTFKVLDSIRNFNPDCKYLNISSAAVYGNPITLPIRESGNMLPLSPYGWHKYYGELVCKEYHTLYGMSTCSVRPFSVYGPGLRKQLFWDIYQKSLKADEDLILYGTGNESRDFIYITDLVRSLYLILEKGEVKGEVYNVGSGFETTIHYAAGEFIKFINPSLNIKFSGEHRIGDPNNWCADITMMKKLGFKQEVPLEQGLQNYAIWVKERE